MDFFVTALDLNSIELPKDRVYDGVSLKDTLFGQGKIPRDSYFYYHQGELYAIRYNQYKAHYYTRSGFSEFPPEPHDPPLLFNLEHDPGEQYPLDTSTAENKLILQKIDQILKDHQSKLEPGPPQFQLIDPELGPCCNKETNCFCGPW